MKRTPLLRKTPMRRTGWNRKPCKCDACHSATNTRKAMYSQMTSIMQGMVRAKRPHPRRKNKPSATPAERAHLAWVKSQPCILSKYFWELCDGVVEAHHIRAGQGMGQKAPHFDTLPLCQLHHRSFHDAAQTWQAQYGTERDLLAQFKKEHGIER